MWKETLPVCRGRFESEMRKQEENTFPLVSGGKVYKKQYKTRLLFIMALRNDKSILSSLSKLMS